jgi:hypothetical protein
LDFEFKIASDWTKNIAADWSEFATAAATVVGLLATVVSIWIASYLASRQRNEALDQAKRDQKWRRTVEAQAAIRRLLDDRRAFDAMSMLDYWDGQKFPIEGKPTEIKGSDIVDALKAVGPGFTPTQAFIRAAMDSLFNHFELIQQGIKAKVYKLKDVKFPIDYYIKRMGEIGKETFLKYNEENRFHKSKDLITTILDLPSEDTKSKDSKRKDCGGGA